MHLAKCCGGEENLLMSLVRLLQHTFYMYIHNYGAQTHELTRERTATPVWHCPTTSRDYD